MTKAYISIFPSMRMFNRYMFSDLIEGHDIECVYAETLSSFDEMEREISGSDVYVTFSDMENWYETFNAGAEANYALRSGVPIVIIKTGPKADYLGREPISNYAQAAVFDFKNGLDLGDIPGFILDHAQKGRETDDTFIRSRLEKPYTGSEPHIFISYSHKDRNEVFEVIRAMQEAGYRIWYDEGIDPASEWDENIAEHISGCSYLIAFISPNYIESQNCRDEISYARDLRKERLLVYLEDTKLPAGMAMRLMRLQAIHKYKYARSGDFYEKLFSSQGMDVAKK